MNYYFSDKLLFEVVDQVKIWSIIFDYEIDITKKHRNPFREDKNPSCWFEYKNKKLIFYDYASYVFNGLDVIEGLKYRFTLTYLEAVNMAYNIHIYNEDVTNNISYFTDNFKFHLEYIGRDFNVADKNYWTKKGITKAQLIEDNIVPVYYYRCNSKKNPNTLYNFYPHFAWAINFKSGNKKIVIPNEELRFVTDNSVDDIGGIWDIDKEHIIVSKSYKDYRQLKNSGFNALFIPSENCKPDSLLEITSSFKDVIIFFDNDSPGRICSEQMLKFLPNSREVFIPKKYDCKDPDELKMKYFNDCTNILKSIIWT